MKIKVYSLAVDGPKCGTAGGAYATEREAFLSLLENAGINEEETKAATDCFDAGGDWIEYLQSITAGVTWNLEECEIEVLETPEQLASLKPAAVKLVGKRIAELERQKGELLAALQTIVRKSYLRAGKHEDCAVHPDLIAAAREVIAKVKGEK